VVNNLDSFKDIYPFDSHFFNLNPYKYHYIDEGKGEVLLFLHGNPTWSFYYRNLIKSFQNKYRCIAPDHIGCGFSDKPQDYNYTLSTHIDNLEQLVNSLGLKDITLVMHDWGGSIGMGLAVRQPKLIKRLVLFNTAAFLSLNIPFRIELCRKPVIGLLAIRCFNMFVRGVLRFGIKDKDVLTYQVRAGYLSPYNTFKNRIGNLRFVQDIPMNSSVQSYSVLENIEKNLKLFSELPVLITWGGKDFCFNSKFLDKWREVFPAAKIHVIDSAGHLVVEDSTKEVIELMRVFLGENNIY
jgi:pimeloyl-ACP methyl ester carboxylesterase